MTSTGYEDHVKQLILAHTGLVLREDEYGRLQKAIASRLQRLHLSDATQYCELLRRNGAEWDELIPLLTTGETYFLRDEGQCGVLEHHILPRLIERNRHRRSLRLWSAGCSSGEEAYSLAILVDKLLPDRNHWEIQIVGTDINPQALQQARRARYGSWSFRMLGHDFRTRYFRPSGNQWEIIDSIRSLVSFHPGNLVADALPNSAKALHEVDLILCRNVFIYFHHQAIAAVLSKLIATLLPGGYLLTGHTELHGQELGPLRLRLYPGAVVYEHTGGAAAERAPGAGREASGDHSRARQNGPKGHTHTTSAASALTRGTTSSSRAPLAKPPAAPGRSPAAPPPAVAPAAGTSAGAMSVADVEDLLDRGEYRRAIEAAARLGSVAAYRPQAILLAARAHANLGEHEAARRGCLELVDRDPLNADAYYLLAHLAAERGEREEIKRLLKKVLYADARYVAAQLELGALYEEDGQIERASRMRVAAVQLLKAMPDDAPIPHWPGVSVKQLRATVEQAIARAAAPTRAHEHRR